MRIWFPIALAACDSLAGPAYVGNPLITLRGELDATGSPAGATELALLWQDAVDAGGPGAVSTILPLSVSSDSSFVAPVPSGPPPEAMFQIAEGEPRLAEGFIYVASRPSRLLGLVRDHVLVYASDDVADGTRAAMYLGGAVPAGFHLFSYTPVSPPPASQADLVARCEASGASTTACLARRSYQLAVAPPDDVIHVAGSGQ